MTRPKMTDAEKSEAAGVRDYLKALEQNAPRRGRKRTPESVARQIAAVALRWPRPPSPNAWA